MNPFSKVIKNLLHQCSARPTEKEKITSLEISGIYYIEKKGNLFQPCSSLSLQTSAYKDYNAQEQSSQDGKANNLLFG